MSYQAKKPRKKQLKIKLTRCWYITVEDESGFEVDNDYCFGTREDAMRDGERMLKAIKEAMQEADAE